jgi:prophage antirepressor-like protein
MSLTIFQFEQQSIRTGDIDGQPVFCLTDLLAAIRSSTKLVDAQSSIADVFGEGQVISLPTTDALQRERETLFVFESGATFLISRSRTAAGKKLNHWLHIEVLPSIRKTGGYQKPELSKIDLARMVIASEEAKIESERRILTLQSQIEADEPATILGKAIAKAPNNIRIGDFAKAIGMGQNRYFDELRTDGIIQQTSTLPYQQFLNPGYFVVTQIISGNGKTYPVALITPKGQTYLAKRHSKFISQEAMRDAIECQVVALV